MKNPVPLTLSLALAIFLFTGCPEGANKPKEGMPGPRESDSMAGSFSAPAPDENATADHLWTVVTKSGLPNTEWRIAPTEYTLFRVNHDSLLTLLDGSKTRVPLPVKDGIEVFLLEDAGTMSPGLAAKFPQIKSYKGKAEVGETTVRVDHNEKGLHVEYSTPSGKHYLSPLLEGNLYFYAFYPENAITPGPRGER